MRVLIFGLSGSGKTTLAQKLNVILGFTRINGDEVRKRFNDWDFSIDGRLRQAHRIREEADNAELALIDFIAPLHEQRTIIKPDYTIWMNTTFSSKYKDTDQVFEKPLVFNECVESFNYDVQQIAERIRYEL